MSIRHNRLNMNKKHKNTKLLKHLFLIITILIISLQPILSQKEVVRDSFITETNPLLSGLHTLSIHVRDTITHDSVFHFLVDKLKLPVYYYPLNYGKRKYAGVYAGNLVLEPCGPYANFSYASNDFRAIFFGLTFEPNKSISQTAKYLTERKISNEAGDTYIYIKDSVLCGENITISFMDKGDEKINDKRKMDSLLYDMNTSTDNELGIEYVKEIRIGYKNSSNLQKWKELISPSELYYNEIWKESNILEFHFIRGDYKEVKSITFKVKSLKKAAQYLLKNDLYGCLQDNKIELDNAQTFGLSIYLTEVSSLPSMLHSVQALSLEVFLLSLYLGY